MALPKEVYNDGVAERESVVDPGFRFYPTEEELVGFYLRKRVQDGNPLNFDIVIATLDLYRYDPWELPGFAPYPQEGQWFFFVLGEQKKSCHHHNRMKVLGYWKATCLDRVVRNNLLQCIGFNKTLVLYKGKGQDGQKTDWIMNEYWMLDFSSSAHKMKDIVLCQIYRKAVSQKTMNLQRAKPDVVEKEYEPVNLGDEYEHKSHSIGLNRSSIQSSPTPETDEVSSLYYN